jgi:CRISPR-associated Cas5-like protein
MASRIFELRVRGELACFTRPEMKVERVSYEVMTPSAARGVLEAILWKPAIRWQIHQVAALAPIRWASIRRNEVKDLASPRIPFIVADTPDQRSQRNDDGGDERTGRGSGRHHASGAGALGAAIGTTTPSQPPAATRSTRVQPCGTSSSMNPRTSS